MLVIMYRFFDHLSFYLLEVIVHFQRANPGNMLLGLLIWPNYFYQCWSTIVVKLIFFVRFLGELKIPKRHFVINWPLARVPLCCHSSPQLGRPYAQQHIDLVPRKKNKKKSLLNWTGKGEGVFCNFFRGKKIV